MWLCHTYVQPPLFLVTHPPGTVTHYKAIRVHWAYDNWCVAGGQERTAGLSNVPLIITPKVTKDLKGANVFGAMYKIIIRNTLRV